MRHLLFYLFLSTVYCLLFTVSGCGYRIIGSQPLPFSSVTINAVHNNTYEPKLEDKLRNALSVEFINQGIEVRKAGGEVELDATITLFQLGALAAVDELTKEQEVTLKADIRLNDRGKITEYRSIESPIKITFQTTGTVTQSSARKEQASEKACSEIAKEIVSRIILRYVK